MMIVSRLQPDLADILLSNPPQDCALALPTCCARSQTSALPHSPTKMRTEVLVADT